MQVHVRYFAAAREATGRGEEALELPAPCTVAQALTAICERHARLAALLPTLRCALDERFAGPQAALCEGSVLALIPPVGGG